MMKITENTLVPLGAVVVFVGTFIGGVVFLVTLDIKADATAEAVKKIESRGEYYVSSIEGIGERLQGIRERLIVIETELKKINRRN